jgi:hypothetical protein
MDLSILVEPGQDTRLIGGVGEVGPGVDLQPTAPSKATQSTEKRNSPTIENPIEKITLASPSTRGIRARSDGSF